MNLRLLLLCAVTAFSTPVFAADKNDPPAYFDATTIPPTLLTTPPAPHSERWNADIDYMIANQQNPDPAEVEEAGKEKGMAPEMVSKAVLPGLRRSLYPKTYALLDRAARTAQPIVGKAKNYWGTKRPYLSDERIQVLAGARDRNPAYPSGHTAGAFVWAHVLGMLIPEKRDAFIARAEEIGQHRVLIGVHYPHDVEGGKELALLIVGALMLDPVFSQELAAAQGEIQASAPPGTTPALSRKLH